MSQFTIIIDRNSDDLLCPQWPGQEFSFGGPRVSGGRKSPVGSRGEAPVGGRPWNPLCLGFVPQKLKQFADIVYKF